MNPSPRAVPRNQPWYRPQMFFTATLLGALGLAASACEDKGIGRVCDVQADGTSMQSIVNTQALECPSRLCLKPAKDNAKATEVKTTSLCTAECSKDSDCDGESRNSKDAMDFRCVTGFVCGVVFEVGPLCCKKLCMCKDFVTIPPEGLKTPPSCASGTSSMCANVH